MSEVDEDFKNELLESLPDAIVWVKPVKDGNRTVDFEFHFSNKKGDDAINHPKGSLKGLCVLKDAIPGPSTCNENFLNYLKVYETGESTEYSFASAYSGQTLETLRRTFKGGVLSTSRERENQREAGKKELENSILNASLNGIYSLKAVRNQEREIVDFTYLFANRITAGLLGLDAKEMVGKSVLQLIPENKTNGFFELFCRVLETGNPVHDEIHFIAAPLNSWFEYAIVKMGTDTLLVSLQDISDRKEFTHRVEQQKNLLDRILRHSPAGIVVTQLIRDRNGKINDGKTILANETSGKILDISLDTILKKRISELDKGLSGRPLFHKALHTLQTGESFITEYYFKAKDKWLELSVAKMDDDHLINVFTDVTSLKSAQLQVERSVERLNAVFNNAQSGMFIFAPERNTAGEIIDFRFVITNPTFAAYVGQTPEKLNGDLGSTWFPGYLHNGVFDMYKKTYLTGELQRTNVHYNVDGLDIYLDLMSTKTGDEVLVTFNDYTQLKRAQMALEKYVEELKYSNRNLEEFAYAASHDLKEPVRKIHSFADRLRTRLKDKMDSEEERLFERIEYTADRMDKLIEDLLILSEVTAGIVETEEVDLNRKISLVLEVLDLEIEEKGAKLHIDKLPLITGHKRQLQQLFQNIISNSLKYSKPGVAAEIIITYNKVMGTQTGLTLRPEEELQEFHLIEIRDNGIGFEQEHSEVIFNVFTRLHGNREYKGTGVGLSIARKVMTNHHGYIWAESQPGKGAAFKLIFPVPGNN